MLSKKLQRYFLVLMIPLLSISLLTACSDDNSSSVGPSPEPEPEDPNLVELAQNNDDFSTLAQLVVELDLADVLATDELTVFAPTNAAFEAISDIIPTLTNEQLAEIVTYHVTAGSILSNQLGARQDVEMLQGERTLVEASAAGVRINGFANVVDADLQASNGVIHAIDRVILPTEYRVAIQGPSLVEVARDAGNFEILLDLVETVGLTTTLQFLGPFTAFAPTDDAFSTLFESVDPASLSGEQIGFILTYHVLFDEVPSSALQAEQSLPTAAEEEIFITSGEEGVFANGNAEVIQPDVEASNGIIHVIDNVLLPNAFIPVTGIVAKNYSLTTLLSLVAEREEILNLLAGDGEFTVFAPTNEAIDAALEAFPDLTGEQITEILTYHVLGAQVLSTDLSDGQTAETLQGENITVSVNGGVQINTAGLITADQIGSNGVVHIIDSVLVPPIYLE